MRNCDNSQGMYDLRVWPNQEADGNINTTTPGKGKSSSKNNQMQRFGKLYKEYCNGQIPKVGGMSIKKNQILA